MTHIEPKGSFLKTCPHCGKEIKAKADLCKFCHGDVSPTAMAAAADAARVRSDPHPDTKTCRFCAEEIKWDARVCKHCQRDLATGLGPMAGGSAGPQWNKGVAAVLSFFIPGLGQIYKGQILNGFVWLIAVLVAYLFLIFPGIILHIWCIVGAASGDPMKRRGSFGSAKTA
jgi:hypothetical protein